MSGQKRTRAMAAAVPIVAAVSILYAIVAGLRLSIWHQPTLVAIGVLLGGAVVLGLAAAFGAPRTRALIFGAVILLALDAALDLGALAGALVPWASPPRTAAHLVLLRIASVTVLGSLLAAASWLFWRMGPQAQPLALIMLSASLVPTVATSPGLKLLPSRSALPSPETWIQQWQSTPPPASSLPVVLHVILDELISPGAIALDLPRADEVRNLMYGFAQRHAFRLYDSIYARHFWTSGSLALVMNADVDGTVTEPRTVLDYGLTRNGHFREMDTRGYRIAVFQSAVLDWCNAHPVGLCATYPSYDPSVLGADAVAGRDRPEHVLDLILRSLEPAYSARIGRRWLSRWFGTDRQDLTSLGVADRFDVEGFDPWFASFVQFALSAPRGTYLLGHFLAPHSPYRLTESCHLAGQVDGGYFLNQREMDEARRGRRRTQYYEAYLRQVQCVIGRLDAMMDQIAASPALRDAKVVIHGDHGSRISAGYDVGELSERDFVDNFGTFFAVREPAIEPGIDCHFSSLPEVFQAVAHDQLPDDEPDPIVINDAGEPGGLSEAHMPLFGCAADASPDEDT
jgi:hypothetical protein